MDLLSNLLIFASDTTPAEGGGSSTGGSTEKLMEGLQNMVKSPIFYVVIGVIVSSSISPTVPVNKLVTKDI